MAASYATELEALNALCDKADTIISALNTLNGKVSTETTVSSIKTTAGNIKTNTDTVVGETPDIRNKVTDIKLVRAYIGDLADKRAKAEAEITDLLAQGYRPYMTLGVSEDLARIAFAKYTGANAPVIA